MVKFRCLLAKSWNHPTSPCCCTAAPACQCIPWWRLRRRTSPGPAPWAPALLRRPPALPRRAPSGWRSATGPATPDRRSAETGRRTDRRRRGHRRRKPGKGGLGCKNEMELKACAKNSINFLQSSSPLQFYHNPFQPVWPIFFFFKSPTRSVLIAKNRQHF